MAAVKSGPETDKGGMTLMRSGRGGRDSAFNAF